MYSRGTGQEFVVILLYVDDIILSCPSMSVISDVKSFFSKAFRPKDLGDLKYFWGLRLLDQKLALLSIKDNMLYKFWTLHVS